MCRFFSFVSDGNGKYMGFDWDLRQKCLSGELKYNPDSHTSIADYCGYIGEKEDDLNKYEYNPLSKKFKVDQINTKNDCADAEVFVRALDFKTIVPALLIKPIVNPFLTENSVEPQDVENLSKWASFWDSVGASVWDSVGASVWDSVGDSVRDSVGDSVWDSVWASVWDSVGASVRASVGASVWDSVWDSVLDSFGDSVWDSVGAYISSFFDVDYQYDFTPCIDLWERGFVPGFDGKTWRLHGKNGIVYTMEGENES